jgi:hypothetical protein
MTDHADLIKRSVDIVQVIGDVVQLKRKGGTQDYLGLCPFHHEKTPSFVVHKDRGFFKCFGCGASGDVIKFEQEIGGLPFKEAIKALAERYGVRLDTQRETPRMKAARERALKERLHFLWWRDSLKLALLAQRNRLIKLDRCCTKIELETRPPFSSSEQEKRWSRAVDTAMGVAMRLPVIEEALEQFERTPLERFAELWKEARSNWKPHPWQPVWERLRRLRQSALDARDLSSAFAQLGKVHALIEDLRTMTDPDEFEILVSKEQL